MPKSKDKLRFDSAFVCFFFTFVRSSHKDEVEAVVHDDARFTKWFRDVDQAVSNLYKLIAQCGTLFYTVQPYVYKRTRENTFLIFNVLGCAIEMWS